MFLDRNICQGKTNIRMSFYKPQVCVLKSQLKNRKTSRVKNDPSYVLGVFYLPVDTFSVRKMLSVARPITGVEGGDPTLVT